MLKPLQLHVRLYKRSAGQGLRPGSGLHAFGMAVIARHTPAAADPRLGAQLTLRREQDAAAGETQLSLNLQLLMNSYGDTRNTFIQGRQAIVRQLNRYLAHMAPATRREAARLSVMAADRAAGRALGPTAKAQPAVEAIEGSVMGKKKPQPRARSGEHQPRPVPQGHSRVPDLPGHPAMPPLAGGWRIETVLAHRVTQLVLARQAARLAWQLAAPPAPGGFQPVPVSGAAAGQRPAPPPPQAPTQLPARAGGQPDPARGPVAPALIYSLRPVAPPPRIETPPGRLPAATPAPRAQPVRAARVVDAARSRPTMPVLTRTVNQALMLRAHGAAPARLRPGAIVRLAQSLAVRGLPAFGGAPGADGLTHSRPRAIPARYAVTAGANAAPASAGRYPMARGAAWANYWARQPADEPNRVAAHVLPVHPAGSQSTFFSHSQSLLHTLLTSQAEAERVGRGARTTAHGDRFRALAPAAESAAERARPATLYDPAQPPRSGGARQAEGTGQGDAGRASPRSIPVGAPMPPRTSDSAAGPLAAASWAARLSVQLAHLARYSRPALGRTARDALPAQAQPWREQRAHAATQPGSSGAMGAVQPLMMTVPAILGRYTLWRTAQRTALPSAPASAAPGQPALQAVPGTAGRVHPLTAMGMPAPIHLSAMLSPTAARVAGITPPLGVNRRAEAALRGDMAGGRNPTPYAGHAHPLAQARPGRPAYAGTLAMDAARTLARRYGRLAQPARVVQALPTHGLGVRRYRMGQRMPPPHGAALDGGIPGARRVGGADAAPLTPMATPVAENPAVWASPASPDLRHTAWEAASGSPAAMPPVPLSLAPFQLPVAGEPPAASHGRPSPAGLTHFDVRAALAVRGAGAQSAADAQPGGALAPVSETALDRITQAAELLEGEAALAAQAADARTFASPAPRHQAPDAGGPDITPRTVEHIVEQVLEAQNLRRISNRVYDVLERRIRQERRRFGL